MSFLRSAYTNRVSFEWLLWFRAFVFVDIWILAEHLWCYYAEKLKQKIKNSPTKIFSFENFIFPPLPCPSLLLWRVRSSLTESKEKYETVIVVNMVNESEVSKIFQFSLFCSPTVCNRYEERNCIGLALRLATIHNSELKDQWRSVRDPPVNTETQENTGSSENPRRGEWQPLRD